jgi:hypothetical protein
MQKGALVAHESKELLMRAYTPSVFSRGGYEGIDSAN